MPENIVPLIKGYDQSQSIVNIINVYTEGDVFCSFQMREKDALTVR